jgi:hypothetical protein
MLLDKKEITVAYRCPACGAGIMSLVGIFALSGDMLKLKCSCGQSELSMVYTPDRKVRLTVPCLVCNKPHNYLLGQNTFFHGDNEVFSLPCSYTGLDLCFIGKQNKVQEALQRANEELAKIMEEAGLNDLNDLHTGEEEMQSMDPELEEIVRYMLSELKEEDKIHCRCSKKSLSSYQFSVQDGYVRIYCEGCGAFTDLPLTGSASADHFLRNCDELILE